jgi:hypothetical protein
LRTKKTRTDTNAGGTFDALRPAAKAARLVPGVLTNLIEIDCGLRHPRQRKGLGIGRWELVEDGTNHTTDFDLTYTRAG